jgi:ribosomal protein L11 methyltransferase
MLRLAVRVRREQAELVLAELLELAPSGVEEVDLGDGLIEYAVYGPPGELPALPDLRAAAAGALIEVRTTEIDDDWAERWREFHRPLVLGDRLTVRPPWEPPGETTLDIVIDPGRAFGTGAHATTRLCLELMLELAPAGSLIDLGCGSGVLAIAAAKLGFEPVTALDYDMASIEATTANAAANGVAVSARPFDLRTERLPQARTVVANLLAPLLLELSARIEHVPQRLIASGILVGETDRVSDALRSSGLAERHRLTHGDWAALLLETSARGQDARAGSWPHGR